MAHLGVMCPNTPGHINPMMALAHALRGLGHQVTFFLLGDLPASLVAAGFEVISIGGTVFPVDEFRAAFQKLGTLHGRAAMKHTFWIGDRSAEALLKEGPTAVRKSGVSALILDQTTSTGGTIADELGLPFATICNALLLHPDASVPPPFTAWRPSNFWGARLRNRIAWSAANRLYAPILKKIQQRRRELGLPGLRQVEDAWSSRLQISQQPEAFEFPRRNLPKQLRFVGSLRLPANSQPASFPWDKLDGRPFIYASLGTLQNRIAATFQTIAEACAGLEVQLVITTGGGITPEDLGPLPGRPIVVSYAPQMELLSRGALALTHAGLNTVLEALSAGVPMVAVPVTNEQPGVAARVRWVGAGEAIAIKNVTAKNLRPLVERVLTEPSYRAAAERMRDAIQTSGGAARAAALIELSLNLGGTNQVNSS